MPQHTPGPWEVVEYEAEEGDFWKEIEPDVACVRKGREAIANARLIAAAPDLLAALKALAKEVFGCYGNAHQAQMDMARAAIAKAEGKSQS